ncbi:MAG: putative ABC-class ATPase [Myxococcota bacterium]|jgi:predicted ABC-class ATPase
MNSLLSTLRRIDGRGYKAWKDIQGEFAFERHTLFVDHVQGDPFAAPSRVAITVAPGHAGLPESLWSTPARRIATEDYLTRAIWRAIPQICSGSRGSGKSGRVSIDQPGQEVLERTSCLIDGGGIEIRLEVGLPAAGRRVLGREGEAILCRELPSLIAATLLEGAHDLAAMTRHADAVEDQRVLRGRLANLGLSAFVAEGAILPRASGVDDRPLDNTAIPFGPIPESLLTTLDLPHRGPVRGLGIPCGLVLIVGGGYHGKSTLLEALARGIYDHIPGDGRELVVANGRALAVRAEDGRRVTRVGIDSFISDLPNGTDTRVFDTERASGSTSQAAGIMEGLEAGSDLLLIDEDTSASNFLVRDHRMQRLVPADKEPITPFVDRVTGLFEELAVSTIMVLGGSSDYFEPARHVIQMDHYRPVDVTDQVRQLVVDLPSPRLPMPPSTLHIRRRAPLRRGMSPQSQRRPGRNHVQARQTRAIQLGGEEIDISLLSQLVHPSQTRAVADALVFVHDELVDGARSMGAIADALRTQIETRGVTAYAARTFGNRAAVRALDVLCALNRLRTLNVVPLDPGEIADDEH